MKTFITALVAVAATMFTMRSDLTPEQADILSHMSIVRLSDGLGGSVPTLRITGLNMQIVNGTGQTSSVNKLGNLIIGYDELNAVDAYHLGSHNLVMGIGNNHGASAFGAIVTGQGNNVNGAHSSVLSARDSINDGTFSTVIASETSQVFLDSEFGAVLSGELNAVLADNAIVTGGLGNFINVNGPWGSVGGGWIRTVFTPRDWAAGTLYEDD
jgi:hypothetical protein